VVNCSHDIVVCFPASAALLAPGDEGYVWEAGAHNYGPHCCESEGCVLNAGACVSLGLTGFFAGGFNTGISGWRHDWTVRVRWAMVYAFSDLHASFAGTLGGRVFKSFTEGAGADPGGTADLNPLQIPA
jgi:hypothetical protein